jgi:hypothetical protein
VKLHGENSSLLGISIRLLFVLIYPFPAVMLDAIQIEAEVHDENRY